jgi:glycosyltransferase involved in cell wall biosynthesis
VADPRLIDLTRLASRAGLGAPTGIDRVEMAWAERLIAGPEPVFALVRMKLGFALLDRAGARALVARAAGQAALGQSDLIGRILWRRAPHRARCEADLRRIAVKRAAPWGLRGLLSQVGPGFDYFNVGHANLTATGLGAIRKAGGRIAVLVHDTIPLDHPEFTRQGIPAVFGRKLAAVSAHADLVLHSTHDARAKTEVHLARAGRVPPGLVANLGVVLAAPEPALVPLVLLDRPFVLALGTIEPRKNLGLLCEVWAGTPGLPDLYVVGHKGWAAPELFERLGATSGIRMLGALPDGAVAALMQRALGLVFPSLAEGFGLPPMEAAGRGIPVLCSDLPVLRELLGELPVYLKPTDVYAWTKAIQSLEETGAGPAGTDRAAAGSGFDLPTWDAHFNLILSIPVQDLAGTRLGMAR